MIMPLRLFGSGKAIVSRGVDDDLDTDQFRIGSVAVIQLALDQSARNGLAVVMGDHPRLAGKMPQGVKMERPSLAGLGPRRRDKGGSSDSN